MTRIPALVTGLMATTLLFVATGCAPASPREAVPPSATPADPSAAPPVEGDEGAEVAGAWRPVGEPTTLASGLDAPWSVVPVPEGGALIGQRDDGLVVRMDPDGATREVGTVPDVVSGGEAGLHGLAVRDDDAGDRWLYAYHAAQDDNRVVRMRVDGAEGSESLGPAQTVLVGIERASTHGGGRIAFGPDGFLYVATGDAQSPELAQDPTSLNGKILRLTPEGDAAAGNPFGDLVYSLGHRNVQGLAWTADGWLWASEFGANTWDELNRIEAGGNYGWPEVEGIAEQDGFIDPEVQWATADASPSGIAALGTTVFVTGLRGERLWVVQTAAGDVVGEPEAVLAGEQGRLRDVVRAPDDSLWVLTNNTDGRGTPREGDDLLLRLELESAD